MPGRIRVAAGRGSLRSSAQRGSCSTYPFRSVRSDAAALDGREVCVLADHEESRTRPFEGQDRDRPGREDGHAREVQGRPDLQRPSARRCSPRGTSKRFWRAIAGSSWGFSWMFSGSSRLPSRTDSAMCHPTAQAFPPTQISVTASAGTEMGERLELGRVGGEGHVPHIPGVGDAIDAEKDLRCLVGDGAARPKRRHLRRPVRLRGGRRTRRCRLDRHAAGRPCARRGRRRSLRPSAQRAEAGGEQAHEDHGDDRGRRVHARPGAARDDQAGELLELHVAALRIRWCGRPLATPRVAAAAPGGPLACHDVPRCGTRSPSRQIQPPASARTAIDRVSRTTLRSLQGSARDHRSPGGRPRLRSAPDATRLGPARGPDRGVPPGARGVGRATPRVAGTGPRGGRRRGGARDGGLVPFRGELHHIRVVAAGSTVRKSTVEAVPGPDGPALEVRVGTGERRGLDRVLTAWLRARPGRHRRGRRRHAAPLGVRPLKVDIRDPRSRWGSASRKGRLMFSWRLLLAPLAHPAETVIMQATPNPISSPGPVLDPGLVNSRPTVSSQTFVGVLVWLLFFCSFFTVPLVCSILLCFLLHILPLL